MIHFSCRPETGTSDAIVTGTLRNLTEDPIELNLEIELYLDQQDTRLILADIEGGNVLRPGKYVRFDAIATGISHRAKNCGLRFQDSRGRPIYVLDRTPTGQSGIRK